MNLELPAPTIDFGYSRPGSARPVKAPAEVASPADLPPRLYLGTLDPASFAATTSGWHALWRDADPGTHVAVSYERSSNRLRIEQSYLQQPVLSSVVANTFSESLPFCYGAFPAGWDALAREIAEESWHLRYLEMKATTLPALAFFPDGHLCSVVVPVAVRQLSRVPFFVRAVAVDPAVAISVRATAHLLGSVVNHVEGRAHSSSLTPAAAHARAALTFGLPLVSEPVLESARDGTRALTVHRRHYLLVVDVFFRDLLRVLRHLARHGLVRDRSDDTDAGAFDFSALVLPASACLRAEHISFWDPLRTRRMVFGRLRHPGPLDAPVTAAADGATAGCQVAAAERWSAAWLGALAARSAAGVAVNPTRA